MNADISPMHVCKSGRESCYCRPENCDGNGACGKPIAPIIDADGKQREDFAARGRV